MLLASGALALGEIKTVTEHKDTDHSTFAYRFKTVPGPSTNDAATTAKFTIVDGERDDNGGGLDKLNDGKLPSEEDQPLENFFFNAGTKGGRVRADLGSVREIKQVNTYSWHSNTRAPQVYDLFASDGKAEGFKSEPKSGTDPETCGWKRLAKVDTRPKSGEPGGQYGVSISDSEGVIGKYRYLLFDMMQTEDTDPFGNTFYSEIDVITADSPEAAAKTNGIIVVQAPDGSCEITIDTTKALDLSDWAETKLAPVLAEWYPKIVAMLPSDGYTAPKKFSVTIAPGDGVAATGGTRVTANSSWLKNRRGEMSPEAVGALLHEEVHVIQQYGRARRDNPNATRSPGWLVEGIPDYIRWFKFEPQSHGADIVWMRGRRNFTPKYDGSYRITANFLDYVTTKYAPALVTKLNAAMRMGNYKADLWKEITGKTVEDLGDEWKKSVEEQLAAKPAAVNQLTEAEKSAGWQLLFNGQNFDGWHNFGREGVRPGWQVTNDELVCVDPHNAGDIVTAGKYGWFELQLDYNISEGGNSGIMYHVTDEARAAWGTGPEFQLEDNAKAADPQRCGWLYALYQPPVDPNTGKPLDATKPAGEWNHVRLILSPEKCVHEINGVKYFEYVLGSDDFKARVAKSKFASMPHFAKADSGYIALQGDHGSISFRNIKVRPISP
jgi:hypothetical protein